MVAPEHERIVEVNHRQLQHFVNTDPPCQAIELPEGLLLRYTQSQSLYFYLKTVVENGKLHTRAFASDSPYDREKASIGEVKTPMFEDNAEFQHFKKLEGILRTWVDFVSEDPNLGTDFTSFPLGRGAF